MKKLYLALLAGLLLGCAGVQEKTIADQFTSAFGQCNYPLLKGVVIDTVEEWHPNITSFQPPETYEDVHFFKLIANDTIFNVAVVDGDAVLRDLHCIQFCYPIGEKWYIDFFEEVNINLSFLNDFGYQVSSRRGLMYTFSYTEGHSWLDDRWTLDSCTTQPLVKFIEIDNDELLVYYNLLGEYKFIAYDQKGRFLNMEDTSVVDFNIAILAEQYLVLKDEKVSNSFYYFSPFSRFKVENE